MKKHSLVILALISVLMLACSCPLWLYFFPGEDVSPGSPPPAAQAPAPQPPQIQPPITRQTVVVVTQVVTVEATQVEATATVAPTDAPTAEPTITPTATPSDPLVTPLKDPVNCRYGPSVNYEQVFALNLDAFAPVTGKSSDGGWFQVQIPNTNNQFCWVAVSVVIPSGDLSGIKTVSAPVALIKDVTFQIKPASANAGMNCYGPFPKFSLQGAVSTNGPVDVKWQIETEQDGKVKSQTFSFSKFGSQELSFSYAPSYWKKGNFWVRLVITSPTQILKEVTYQVKCE